MSYMEFLATYGGRFVDRATVTAQQTVLAIVVAVSITVLSSSGDDRRRSVPV